MTTNNFKAFGIGAGANVTGQTDYEALTALLTGFQSGKASSAQINKALRQGTVMASVLAQFIADSANVDVLDDGNLANILANMKLGMKTLTPGRVLATRAWLTNTIYTQTPGTTQVEIWLVGGGGGSGGAAATGSGQFSAGGGGIAGAFAYTGLIAVPASGTVITVGSGGVGAAAGNNNGSPGGVSSVGSIISCPGGGGGAGGGASSYSNTVARIGDPSAAPTGATFLTVRGAPATNVVGFSSGLIKGGDGGASFFGTGGAGGHSVTNAAGAPGLNYGSGGGGPAIGQNGGAQSGANGFGGIVIIKEYA